MNDAPLFFQSAPKKPSTWRSLAVAAGGAAAWGGLVGLAAANRAAGLADPIPSLGWMIALGAAPGAAGAAGLLYLAVGRRSGDRGGPLDFCLMAAVVVLAALLVVAPTLSRAITAQEDQKTFAAFEAQYRGALENDDREFKIALARVHPQQGLTFSDLRTPADIARARANTVKARALIADYTEKARQRRKDARARLKAVDFSPDGAKRIPPAFEERLLDDEQIRIAQKGLLEEVLAAEDYVVAFIGRGPGQWEGKRYMIRSQADLATARQRIADLDAAARTLQTFERRNGLW
jgi:type II secretory pathway pseudopilin PulG